METTALEVNKIPEESSFSMAGFEHAQRVAKMLASSTLVPKEYQNRVDNCLIALEMSNRNGASPFMVMQNLHIIQGRPSWSSPFIIASLNACGRFSKLNFQKSGEGEDYGYEAWAIDLKSGDKITGPKVTWKMVKDEGWYGKPGSKWKTMPELMFQYRSAAFFGRLHAPDVLMGMQTADEIIDVSHEAQTVKPINKEEERVRLMIADSQTVEDLNKLKPHLKDGQFDLFNSRMVEIQTKK